MDDRKSVANILEIEDKSLRYFLYSKKPDTLYTKFIIRKENGGERVILAPSPRLKSIQKKMAYILNLVYKPKPCTYGFIKNRTIIDNAKQHARRNLILNIDLKDFFTQIHFGRIRGMLYSQPYGLPKEVATTISQLVCHAGVLPQGAPSSPIITNMICKPLDNQLIMLAKKYGIRYSRYADDITFSTFRDEFPESIINGESQSLKIGDELMNLLDRNSFIINKNKVFLNFNNQRQEVTGLVVNRFPNIKREYIKELRAILHNCERNGVYESAIKYIQKGKCKNKNILGKATDEGHSEEIIHWFKGVLRGKINFIKEVRGSNNGIFLKYAKQLNNIFQEEIFNTNITNILNEKIADNVFIMQNIEGEEYRQGTCFVLKGLGILTNYHTTEKGFSHSLFKYNEHDHRIGTIGKEINEEKSSKEIDYALYGIMRDSPNGFELGDSTKLNIGDAVTIIGYPDYNKDDTPYVENCVITSIKNNYHGSALYTVSGRIIHGTSGGPVLDKDNKVIGLIKGGIATLNDEHASNNQGFIPIHKVINDICEQ